MHLEKMHRKRGDRTVDSCLPSCEPLGAPLAYSHSGLRHHLVAILVVFEDVGEGLRPQ